MSNSKTTRITLRIKNDDYYGKRIIQVLNKDIDELSRNKRIIEDIYFAECFRNAYDHKKSLTDILVMLLSDEKQTTTKNENTENPKYSTNENNTVLDGQKTLDDYVEIVDEKVIDSNEVFNMLNSIK